MGYVDWSITVPLQMIEFNLILMAAGKTVSSEMFWKLLLGTILMLGFGYAGETAVMNPQIGFAGGLCGWAFILREIFIGEAGGTVADCSEHVSSSYHTMRLYRPVGQYTLLAIYLVTFLVTWMKRSSMWSTMLQILSTRLLSFLHAGLAPRLTLRASTEPCWRETKCYSKVQASGGKNQN